MKRLDICLLLLGVTNCAVAQPVHRQEEGRVTTYRLAVSAAAAPVPAFNQRLLRRDLDIKPGNAAQFYYRAILHLRTSQVYESFGKEWHSWLSDPLSDFPLARARTLCNDASDVLGELDEATLRERCHWAFNERALRGPDVFLFLLPEMNDLRELARVLAVKTRVSVAEGAHAEAVASLRTIYQSSMDTAQSLTVVGQLVGVAMAGVANEQLIEFIGSPNAPNLYWALAELPTPLIDMRGAMRYELDNGMRLFPYLDDAETLRHSPEEWARLITQSLTELSRIGGTADFSGPKWKIEWAAAGLMVKAYPQAKQALIASGMPRDEVELLPPGQVVGIQTKLVYRYLAEGMLRWWYVPFHEARAYMEQDLFGLMESKNAPFGPELVPLARDLLPSLYNARKAQLRLERDIAALRVIEAIRIHMSHHGNKLPPSLDAIQVVPVPHNPATGQPFVYSRENGEAILNLPRKDGLEYGKKFVIRVRESGAVPPRENRS